MIDYALDWWWAFAFYTCAAIAHALHAMRARA